jgi:putative SOS response-associated peptidase YedK
MCGRFAFFGNNRANLESLGVVSDPPLLESYNIAPGQDIVVIRTWPETGVLEYGMLRWGLLPFWSKTAKTKFPLINARAEGIEKKPSFRGPFKYRRCIIPASGFYEWQKRAGCRQPYFIQPKDKSVFLMAGIWDHWEGEGGTIETCSIITTEPNSAVAEIHDRMPAILDQDRALAWLGVSRLPDPGAGQGDLLNMLQPYPAEKMEGYPVNSIVNNARNNSPECIAPKMEQQSLFARQDI